MLRKPTLPSYDELPPKLYKEVKRLIIDCLREREWRVGEALPSEAALAARFQVSVGTLRKAVAELVGEGLLLRQHGRGTYVAAHDSRRQFHFFRIVPKDGSEKKIPVFTLRSFRRSAPTQGMRELLGLSPTDDVFYVENVLHLSARPVVLDSMVIPVALFPGLTKASFRDRESTIYGLYQFEYGVTVVRTIEQLSADSADSDAASVLGVAVGAPLLRIERVAYTFRDRAIELRTRRVNTADFVYLSDLDQSRGGGEVS